MKEHILLYNKPAEIFEEALALGNGSIGAMVYGGLQNEKIGLNQDTLWSGTPGDFLPKNYEGAIDEIRELMAKGERAKASEVVWKKIMTDFPASYSVAGDLFIQLNHSSNIEDYKRELNIENGVARVTYICDGIKYKREYFISFPDKTLSIKISADKLMVSGSVYFDCPHPNNLAYVDGKLFVTSKMPYLTIQADHESADYKKGNYYSDDKPTISYCMGVGVIGGDVLFNQDKLNFSNTNEITIILHINSNFTRFDTAPNGNTDALIKECASVIESAINKGYEQLKKAHTEDFSALMNRCVLSLCDSEASTLATDERLIANEGKLTDYGLYELLFNFARYLLISSSREGTQPANLQGIWNKDLFAAWCSGYTTNINLQMNYWLSETTNLSNCHKPLLDFIKDLSKHGENEAQKLYKCRGWCAHHNSDIWRYSGMVGAKWDNYMPSTSYAAWTEGGAWLVLHIWEHYLFTNDKQFLRENFEIIKGNALFHIDFLTENEDGYLVPSFDTTPENTYFYNDEQIALAQGTANNIAITRTAFDIFLETTKILVIEDTLIDEINNVLDRLLPFGTDENGKLLEWDKPFVSCQPEHVHMAPLFAVYPAALISDKKNEHLLNAVNLLLEERGENGPGHSACWKGCIFSRLKDKEKAYKFLNKFLRFARVDEPRVKGCGTFANLFACHPPFQMDGNFGFAAIVSEMLIQSHKGYIELLPCLPKAWEKGKVQGLVARGGFETEISWENNKLLDAKITALCDSTLEILVEPDWNIIYNGNSFNGDGLVSIELKKNEFCEIKKA